MGDVCFGRSRKKLPAEIDKYYVRWKNGEISVRMGSSGDIHILQHWNVSVISILHIS